ncbi:MAG TPA: SUMF1/EgtB/PvdO family nonheme iron enzyme [Polyangiaceae bacterium]|nr:SUMF1/EgtB/PvdO family nonheme iron enzyme [Polyangiaceae bacterium]
MKYSFTHTPSFLAVLSLAVGTGCSGGGGKHGAQQTDQDANAALLDASSGGGGTHDGGHPHAAGGAAGAMMTPVDAATDSQATDSSLGGDATDYDGGIPAEPTDSAALHDGAANDDASTLSDAGSTDANLDSGPLCSMSDVPHPNDGISEAAGLGGCPSGMALVDAFCIDRYEASLMVGADSGTGSWSPFFSPGTTAVLAISAVGAIPQAYITQVQAKVACAAAGKRLCTNAEWLRACQTTSNNTYPYGSARQDGVCNDARATNPLVDYYGTTDPSIYAHTDNPCLDQLADTVEPTGSLTGCVTSEGIYDLMGNLAEWTADPNGTLLGGSYMDTTINGDGCLNSITAHATTYFDYLTGFRCCANP